MDKFIIFNTLENAQVLNNRLTDSLKGSWVDGVTNNYCEIKKHPEMDLFAVVLDKNYLHLFNESEINQSVELTEDWFIFKINN